MTTDRKLLLPWYQYPPFRAEGTGGLSVTVWELTRELAERGVDVDVLTPPISRGSQSDAQQEVRVIGSEIGEKFVHNQPLNPDENRTLEAYDAILSINNYAARTLRSISQTLDRITRQIHTIGQNRQISTYSSLKPSVVEYIKMFEARRRDERNLGFLAGCRTICVSNYLKHEMQERNLEYSTNLFMIPNGFYQRFFRPMDVENKFDLLFIGRFQRVKGLDILLRALRMVHSRWGEVYELGIAGEFTGEQRAFLLNTVPLAVRERTAFLGTVQREDMPETINSAKLVTVPSRYESFGLPALEAMACGVPVLATRVGGLPEVIDDTVGILFEPNDHESLAQAIHTSVKDTSLTERVAINGPAKAAQYDWSVVAPRILQVLFP
jgi:glycosyltransferase involved in cell wall biosynthesis